MRCNYLTAVGMWLLQAQRSHRDLLTPDVLISVLQYCIVQASLPNFYSESQFAMDFMPQHLSTGEHAYCVVSLLVATEAILRDCNRELPSTASTTHPPVDNQWSCGNCTCLNPELYLSCAACGCERPAPATDEYLDGTSVWLGA